MESGTPGSSEPRAGDKRKRRYSDRFIPDRLDIHTPTPVLSLRNTNRPTDDSPYKSLSSALSVPPSKQRILEFRPPPPPFTPYHLDFQAKCIASEQIAIRAAIPKRKPPYVPFRVLDAPGVEDDFYLNILDWSSKNLVGVALRGSGAFIWDPKDGKVSEIAPESATKTPITSISFAGDGTALAVGMETGDVELWDVETAVKMRTMAGHSARVAALSWSGPTVSSGCRDGSIWHHDVRIPKHKVMEFAGHTKEVSGLKWRADGDFLASGGNDDTIHCWDGRLGASILRTEEDVPKVSPRWKSRDHTASVKALAWCPWQNNLLASGGGARDRQIHLWSATTGKRTGSVKADAQVTSLIFSPHSKEILSTNGYTDKNRNTITLWSYPAMTRVYDLAGHTERVLCSAVSPDGRNVATTSSDETVRFWNIWEAPVKKADGAGTTRMLAGLR